MISIVQRPTILPELQTLLNGIWFTEGRTFHQFNPVSFNFYVNADSLAQ